MKICTICGELSFRISNNKWEYLTSFFENLIKNENITCFFLCYGGKFVDACDDIICELSQKYPSVNKLYFKGVDPMIIFDQDIFNGEYQIQLSLKKDNSFISPSASSLQNKFFKLLENIGMDELLDISDMALFYFDFVKYMPPSPDSIVVKYNPYSILKSATKSDCNIVNLYHFIKK